MRDDRQHRRRRNRAHECLAEILVERGELAEAEDLLLDLLPLWRAFQYRSILVTVLAISAAWHSAPGASTKRSAGSRRPSRTTYTSGRNRKSWKLMPGRRSAISSKGIPMPPSALAVGALARVDASNTKLSAVLQRVRGFALYRQGDLVGARLALDANSLRRKDAARLVRDRPDAARADRAGPRTRHRAAISASRREQFAPREPQGPSRTGDAVRRSLARHRKRAAPSGSRSVEARQLPNHGVRQNAASPTS